LRLISAIVFCVAALIWASSAQARPWRFDDFSAFTLLGDLQLSPDGTRALVNVTKFDLRHIGFDQRETVVDMASGSIKPLFSKSAIHVDHARWSPDGRTIAFLSGKDGDELNVVSASGGTPHRLIPGRFVRFSWSPNGTRIAAIETTTQSGPAKRSISMWVNPEVTIDASDVPAQRTLWVIDVANRAQRRLAQDSYSYGGPATDNDPSWSPDNRKIAAIRQPSPFYAAFERAQYVSVDVATGAVAQIVPERFFAYPGSAAPRYAPQGDAIAYLHTWDGKLAARQDVYDSSRDVSAPLDLDFWSCASSQMAWRGTHILASALDGVAMRLFDFAPGGPIATLTPGAGSVGDFSVSASGRIGVLYSTPQSQAEVYDLTSSGLRQVTHIGKLPSGVDLARTKVLNWSDAAGHTLNGQLALPANPRGAPVIVNPHGGPQCADDNSFDPFSQYFATNGYVFFRPNPRGSDGYGDWSYKAIVNDWGAIPMFDVMAGLDALLAQGYGDTNKLFIEGGSYGGYLTSWIVTHSNRFHAAVAEVPVTDLRLHYTLSESPNITRRFFGSHPIADSVDVMERESPVHFASNMNTPLLIVSGLRDTRAPYPQALEFYKALLDNGKDARMLVYPQAGHGPSDPAGILDDLGHTAGWFASHGGLATPDAILPP